MSVTANPLRRAAAGALFAAAVLAAGPTAAQDAGESETAAGLDNQVVATVNGEEITRTDLDQMANELADQLSRIPPEQQFSVLVNVMIDVRLMARAAEASGLADDDEVKQRLANMRDNQLRAEYLRVNAFEPITDEAVEATFNEELAAFEPADQVRARHILVDTEDEAKAVIADLDAGGDFAEIAQEKSIDPGSGRNGGDLGFFGKGAMVPVFEEAAFGLDIGTYTAEPVESRFGWHVIMTEEARKEPPSTLARRGPAIRQELIRSKLAEVSNALREAATIEVRNPDGTMEPLQ